jgi:hypothetical protein
MTDRKAFVNDVKAQLKEWDSEIDELQAKIAEGGDEAKQRLTPYLTKAHEAREAVVAKLGEIDDAGEHAWDSVKHEAEHTWHSFKNAVNHFKAQL